MGSSNNPIEPSAVRAFSETEARAAAKVGASDWGLAYWFASVNSFLGGKRPQDLLIDTPDRVVDAAKDEVAGVLHG